ncbi:MAG: hypothetical protein U1C50_00275 [Patescibacteria group bacterium]|nr:hypothetical protein [Patescibacteria group bacterium]
MTALEITSSDQSQMALAVGEKGPADRRSSPAPEMKLPFKLEDKMDIGQHQELLGLLGSLVEPWPCNPFPEWHTQDR